jgi:hypothetical protein
MMERVGDRAGDWVVRWRTAAMPASAWWVCATREEALAQCRRLLEGGCEEIEVRRRQAAAGGGKS